MFNGSLKATKDIDRADLFNDYFHSVFTKSNFTLPVHDVSNDVVHPSISNLLITDSDVYEVLASLDISKAKGLDGIGPSVLKCSALGTSTCLNIFSSAKVPQGLLLLARCYMSSLGQTLLDIHSSTVSLVCGTIYHQLTLHYYLLP